MTRRAVLLEALASTPSDVVRLTRGLDETAADGSADGRWSCRAVVAHLAAGEPLFRARLRRVVNEGTPALTPLPPQIAAPGEAASLVELAERFGRARAETLAWLQTLAPGAWQRPAIHETGAHTTLRFLVQDLVAHDIARTGQLAEIRAGRRAARPEGGNQR